MRIRVRVNRLGRFPAMVRTAQAGLGETFGTGRTACRAGIVRVPLCLAALHVEPTAMAAEFLLVFLTVFLAELGDKTQLATLLFAGDGARGPWLVFAAASIALISTTAIAVVVGGITARFVDPAVLKLIAGIGFIAIGIWSLSGYFLRT